MLLQQLKHFYWNTVKTREVEGSVYRADVSSCLKFSIKLNITLPAFQLPYMTYGITSHHVSLLATIHSKKHVDECRENL